MDKFKKSNEQKIEQIVKSLGQHVENCSKAKDKLSQWVDDLGFQIEIGKTQVGLWKNVKPELFSESMVTSGVIISKEMLNQSNRILNSIEDISLGNFINIANTASVSLASTAVSGVSLSYAPNVYPPSYYQVAKIIEQRNDNDNISFRLGKIDSSLADEYDNAWIALHATSTDETRSPMFLMREVVRRLFEFFAPDDEVMKCFDEIKHKEDIKRSHRVEFIVTKINPLEKNIFLAEEGAERSIRKIYGKLSYAHKPGKIDSEKSRGYLYQASTLIKFLLDSFLSDST